MLLRHNAKSSIAQSEHTGTTTPTAARDSREVARA